MFPTLICFIPETLLAALFHLSITKLLANLSSRPASLDGWRRGEVSIFVFTAGRPSLLSKVQLSLIGNNKLAHCV